MSIRQRLRRLLVATAVTLVAAVGGTVVTAGPAHAAAGCVITYSSNTWDNIGFQGNVTIQNQDAPINGWSLRWIFPGIQRVEQAFGADITESSYVATATNKWYNAAIPTGGAVGFSFVGSLAFPNYNLNPVAFVLNGSSCVVNYT